jgi:hypothetical protein
MLKAQNRTLIAKWTAAQDPSDDLPAKVYWADGSSATNNDYVTNSIGTHTLMLGEDGGMECHMFPDIVANLRFDTFADSWIASGPGIEPFALSLPDRNATDSQIIGELFLFPVVYKARIFR